jgi:hypothetical protein
LNGCGKSVQPRRRARLEFAGTQEPDVDEREMVVRPNSITEIAARM